MVLRQWWRCLSVLMTFREGNVRFAGQFGIATQAFSEPVVTVELGSDAAKRRGNTAAFLLATNLLCRCLTMCMRLP